MPVKRLTLFLLLISLGSATGQRVMTTTRLVVLFSGLENEMMTAVAQSHTSTQDRLLAHDFQVWTPQPPGQPIPRAVWLRNAPAQLTSFDLRQMAVRDLGQHASVSFVLTAGGKNYFMVDLWQRAGDGWQLTDRYQAEVKVTMSPARATGKD